jgi:hypothetical protein
MAAFPGWSRVLLEVIGAPVTNENVLFLRAWAACEGGDARYNPLNTTLRLPGSTSYNTAGVQHYADHIMGTAATALTIRLGYYEDIVRALRTPRLTRLQILQRSEGAIRKWGTNPECIRRELHSR